MHMPEAAIQARQRAAETSADDEKDEKASEAPRTYLGQGHWPAFAAQLPSHLPRVSMRIWVT